VLAQSDSCEKNLGDKFSPNALKALEAKDEPDNITELDRVGRLAGSNLVSAANSSPALMAKI
jgi:hypothetical protein